MAQDSAGTVKESERGKHSATDIDVDTQPFVSVLTPVYNGGKFLRECIESVLNQNYENWEYVLVNNRSTDDSLAIMREYVAQDDRIRIHNNEEFLPQMENLNHAFRQISPKSKYCKVVHADDWLFPECLSQMVKVAEEYPSVGIVSSYRLVNNKVDLDGLPYSSNFNSGKEIARKYLLYGHSQFGSPSSLLIKSDLIREREKFYEESHLASDTGACLELLKESDFGFVHDILTFSRRHDESMSNTKCQESFAFIHAKLFSQLDYGSFFLNEKEQQKSFSRILNKYYILLARNLVQQRSLEEFKRQKEVLEKLGLNFEGMRFLKKLIRELFQQLFRYFGLEFKKVSNK
ncbi:glycosyl transferase [Aliifodinibius salipaludis]|uniref:Glycosyl transferase n=1 Tax=Fodinibius salipaludis TaxID=2032627 RepID=A0A2A2G6C1_9BACT|nr:glycosyltransferase family 2 protein [Aliifodinibius salipaludis]PAU92848.1 glycosyl transferase [Aliifodinibius salipaludis]